MKFSKIAFNCSTRKHKTPMILWYWYLLTAAALSFSGYVSLHVLLTAALAAAVPLLFGLFPSKSGTVTWLKAAAAAAAALALLWHGSFLPPPAAIAKFLLNPKMRPTLRYMLEFIWQAVNIRMLFSGAALFAAVFFGYRKRPGLLAFSAYLVLVSALIIQPKPKTIDLNEAQPSASLKENLAELDPFYTRESEWPEQSPAAGARPETTDLGSVSPKAFFEKESGRIVEFPVPAKDPPLFDVIILHICSLSWEDIKDSGANLLPFFSKFDYVFTNFSSASSYSGPAALRVLKAPCGQVPHLNLYQDAAAGCYLMDDLRGSGFKTYSMASNDGKYDDFAEHARKYGHADKLLDVSDLPVAYELFNGSPMYPDDAALGKFWKLRQDSKAPRAALYYNTANLHIGPHRPGDSGKSDNTAFYKERLLTMTSQLEGFFSGIERSGRNAVVIFVPEHGAALVSTKMQPKDVRDIPLPPITTVPAAVRLIGKKFYSGAPKPKVITKPASLLALAWFIAEFINNDPFGKDARRPENLSLEIPGTDFLAENQGSAVMRLRSSYVYSQNGGPWTELPDYAGILPGTIPSVRDFMRGSK